MFQAQADIGQSAQAGDTLQAQRREGQFTSTVKAIKPSAIFLYSADVCCERVGCLMTRVLSTKQSR